MELIISVQIAGIFVSIQFFILLCFIISSKKNVTKWREWCTKKVSRRDKLQHLRDSLYRNGSYVFLQRLGNMAPLVGVLITGFGFMFFDSADDETFNSRNIITLMQPLSAGVVSGALLAILNQVLVHISTEMIKNKLAKEENELPVDDSQIEEIEEGLITFTEKLHKVIPAIDLILKQVTNNAQDHVNIVVEHNKYVVDKMKILADGFVESDRSFKQSTKEFHNIFVKILEKFEQKMNLLQKPFTESSKNIQFSTKEWQNNLEVISRDFNTVLQNFAEKFSSCLNKTTDTIEQSNKTILDIHNNSQKAVKNLLDGSQKIQSSSKNLEKVANSSAKTCENFSRTIQSKLEQPLQQVSESMQKTAEKSNSISKNLVDSSFEFDQCLKIMKQSISDITGSSQNVYHNLESFNKSVKQIENNVQKQEEFIRNNVKKQGEFIKEHTEINTLLFEKYLSVSETLEKSMAKNSNIVENFSQEIDLLLTKTPEIFEKQLEIITKNKIKMRKNKLKNTVKTIKEVFNSLRKKNGRI